MSETEDPRGRLLEAAGRLFAERGYRGATVREICQRAEANIAAVNYYFGGKERLYIEAVKHACRSRERHAPLPVWQPATDPRQKLRDFIATFVARIAGEPSPAWHRRLLMRELSEPTAACMEFVRDLARPQFELLLEVLDEFLPPEMLPRKRHLVALSIIGQCVYHALARPVISHLVGETEYRTYDASALSEHIADFCLAALGGTGDGPAPSRPTARAASPPPRRPAHPSRPSG